MKKILKFIGYVLIAIVIAMGLSVLLTSCEGAFTKDCKCEAYIENTLVGVEYYSKKEHGYKNWEGCLDMQNEFNASKDLTGIRYHCYAENRD